MEFDSDRESVHSEEQLSGETEMKAAEEEAVAGESALRESIRKKGQNSYYYAHGNTSNAPAWDGHSEPRLLHKTVSTEQAPRVEAITSYAWADGKKQVSIYVDYPDADAVEDELIDLKFTETSLNFTIRVSQNLNKSLIIPRLHDAVTDVAVRKKADKFVLVLKKKTEFTWYDLKKAL